MSNVEGSQNVQMTNRAPASFLSFGFRHCFTCKSMSASLRTATALQTGKKIEKYVSVFNIGLQNTFVYRWNYFLRAMFGLIPLAGTVFLWSAVFKERGGSLHGYEYG